MTLGDRVAVLRKGRIEQVAPPMELYRRPATRFVGEFIGSPAMNLYRCRVRHEGGLRLESSGFRLTLAGDAMEVAPDELGNEVVLGIRPHDVERAEEDSEADADGRVDLVEPRGSDLLVRLRLDGEDGEEDADDARALAMIVPPDAELEEDDRVRVRFPRDRLHFFDPDTGGRLD